MPPEIMEKVAEAARRTGLNQADIIRLSAQIGLEDLRRINFDIPKLISESARPSAALRVHSSLAAEEVREDHKQRDQEQQATQYPANKRKLK